VSILVIVRTTVYLCWAEMRMGGHHIHPTRRVARFQMDFCATASDVVVPVRQSACVLDTWILDRLLATSSRSRENRAERGRGHLLLGWSGSGGEWTDGQDGAPHRHRHRHRQSTAVPPLKNEAPFCLYRRRAAVPQRDRRHGHLISRAGCTIPCCCLLGLYLHSE
jgi:hypothetical protein